MAPTHPGWGCPPPSQGCHPSGSSRSSVMRWSSGPPGRHVPNKFCLMPAPPQHPPCSPHAPGLPGGLSCCCDPAGTSQSSVSTSSTPMRHPDCRDWPQPSHGTDRKPQYRSSELQAAGGTTAHQVSHTCPVRPGTGDGKPSDSPGSARQQLHLFLSQQGQDPQGRARPGQTASSSSQSGLPAPPSRRGTDA